jgi:hypothetical protein
MNIVPVNPISPRNLERFDEDGEFMSLKRLALDEICKILNEQLVEKRDELKMESLWTIYIDGGYVEKELTERMKKNLEKVYGESWHDYARSFILDIYKDDFWKYCEPAYRAAAWRVKLTFEFDKPKCWAFHAG